MEIFTNILISFLVALAVSLLAVPETVRIVRQFKVPDKLYPFSANSGAVIYPGGIAIFFSFVMASTFGLYNNELSELSYILGAVILVFFIGLEEDILALSSYKRVVAQVIASLILVFPANERITNLHGLLGIGAIGVVPGVIISCFSIIMVINAFKLISGINGLATGLGILISLVFGSWFTISGYFNYAILSFSLVGSIAGLFLYNLYFHHNKIGMGNAGSLIVGTVISVLLIRFNEFNIDQNQNFAVGSAPIISFVILSYPLSELISWLIYLILEYKSPFRTGSNRFYYRLTALKFSPSQAAMAIIGTNILLISAAFFLHSQVILWSMVLVISGVILVEIPAFYIRKQKMIKDRIRVRQLPLATTSDDNIKSKSSNRRQRKQWAEYHIVNLSIFPEKYNPG